MDPNETAADRPDRAPGGAATTIPRWARERVPGTATHREPLGPELTAGVRALAAREDTDVPAVLLAAHVAVLGALTGEPDVVAGYAVPGSGPRPLYVAADGLTWRELVRASAAARDAATDPDRADPRPGSATPAFDSVLDPGAVADPDRPLTVRLRPEDEGGETGAVLELVHRTEVLDASAARRIAGYHRTALAHAVARPDDDHRATGLVGADEYRHQIHGMAGPPRRLPGYRPHELIAAQARRRPDDIVAEQGERRWTYRELDERVNRLAHALLARGLRPEEPVAVVTERTLEWLAAVLAVLTAGGVYLPVEPHFPADRVARMLTRAGCRIALTEPDSAAAPDGLAGVVALTVRQAWAEDHPVTAPDVEVGADRAAYIYFTSGSTGEPKGAMCEHAGMLNHLLAKIDDLGIGPGTVVAQTAPQCFDISLWQLLAGPMAGGRTVLVAQEEILDVRRFVDRIETAGVEVVQLVPSYLEVVLAHLAAEPRALGSLRRISATGEALKNELVARWFAARPDVALVNAYGLTETSDDTNHAVLHAAPADGRIPLGPPIPGAHVYVVDENLDPVPLGAPGEIVFSGVCVGRGYVGDPERTAAAFRPDPHRPGERLYRSGDHGRWRPDGSLEFLGRKDTQVKVRGFRIEIGEIDNALLRVPGVRDAAVVVARRPNGEPDLVAFWSGPQDDPDVLRAEISRSLPVYMVPAELHPIEALPLTANGKIDRRALARLAEAVPPPIPVAGPDRPPSGPAEERVAAAFARVLGVDPGTVGRHDDFFARGGSSLTAVKLVLALRRAVSLPDVVANPVLADLALLLDRSLLDHGDALTRTP